MFNPPHLFNFHLYSFFLPLSELFKWFCCSNDPVPQQGSLKFYLTLFERLFPHCGVESEGNFFKSIKLQLQRNLAVTNKTRWLGSSNVISGCRVSPGLDSSEHRHMVEFQTGMFVSYSWTFYVEKKIWTLVLNGTLCSIKCSFYESRQFKEEAWTTGKTSSQSSAYTCHWDMNNITGR